MSSGTFGTNWLDLSSTSNCYNRMYVQGFMDISGGNVILRNNNLYMTGGDLSLNGRLFVASDISLNNRLFLQSDASLGGRLFLASDASLGGRLFLAGDLSINGNVTFNSTISSATTSLNKWSAQNLLPINGNWTSIAQTANGQYALAAQNTGSLYLTNTFGSSWTQITSIPTGGAWTAVAMSSTSQYMMATTNGSGVYLSPYYGASGSWVQVPTTTLPTGGNYMNAAMSSTGQYMLVANNTSGAVYMNTGYGVSGSWGAIPSTILATNSTWAGLAMSSTGQYMLVGQNTGSVYLSFNTGQSWLQIPNASLPTNGAWQSLAMSSTGQYMLAGNNSTGSVYLSTTFGTIWTQISTTLPTNGNWFNVTVSPTGQYMMAVNNSAGSAYISTNYGSAWTQVTALPTSSAWSALSLSSTGLYNMVAVKGGAIYTCTFPNTSTTNYVTNMFGSIGVNNPTPQYTLDVSGTVNTSQGLTTTGITGSVTGAFQQNWAPANGLPTATWDLGATAMSSTGQYMLAGIRTGSVYISSNFGGSWRQITTTLPTNGAWRGFSMSSTGQYMYACINGGYVYTSLNYGNTWATISGLSSTGGWFGSATSFTGQYVIIASSSSVGVWLSSDFGSTWLQLSSPNIINNHSWIIPSMSSTGQYMLLANNTSGCVLSTNYGTTWSVIGNGIPSNGVALCTAISSTGQYMLTSADRIVNGNSTPYVFLSNNYGESWTVVSIPSGVFWQQCAMSSTGQYMYLTCWSSPGGVCYSSNYGATWAYVPSLLNNNFYGLSVSSNAQYILASVFGGLLYVSAGTPITTMGINNPTPQYALDHVGSFNLNNAITSGTNYGAPATWSQVTSIGTMNYNGTMSISSTGQYMLVGTYNSNGVFLSQNYGVTWGATPLSTSTSFNCTAMSSTGQYMLASTSSSTASVYLSTNYGYTWSQISTAFLPSSNAYWAMSMSSTGQYMVIGAGQTNLCYVNNNYGAGPWLTPAVGIPGTLTTGFVCMAMSATGQYITACYNTASQGVWMSTNYGSTWTITSLPTLSNWWSVAMSSTGQYMMAGGNSYISMSSNYGATWVVPSIPSFTSSTTCCTISSTGQYMFAYTGNGGYFSNTYGATWITLNLPGMSDGIRFAAMSGNGQYTIASTYGKSLLLSSGTQTVGINNPNPQHALDVVGILINQNPYWVVMNTNFNTNQSVTGGGKIPYNYIYQSNAASFFNTNTYTFYAPVNGVYWVSTSVYLNTSTSRVVIYKNNQTYNYLGFNVTYYTATREVSDIIYLNAGDYLDFRCITACNVYFATPGSGHHSHLEITLLG